MSQLYLDYNEFQARLESSVLASFEFDLIRDSKEPELIIPILFQDVLNIHIDGLLALFIKSQNLKIQNSGYLYDLRIFKSKRTIQDVKSKIKSHLKDASFPLEYISRFFETISGKEIEFTKNGNLEWKKNIEKKDEGVYYTPFDFSCYVTESTLKPILNKISTIHELRKVRVIDPSCGSGSFIIEALDLLVNTYKSLGGRSKNLNQIVLDCLFGVDIDARAISLTKAIVCIKIGCSDLVFLKKLSFNFKVGDALLGFSKNPTPLTIEKKIQWKAINELISTFSLVEHKQEAFHWVEQFPQVFSESDPGFTVILGNPPWGKVKPNRKEYFQYLDSLVKNLQGKKLTKYLEDEFYEANSDVEKEWNRYKQNLKKYSIILKMLHDFEFVGTTTSGIANGDTDLYKLFMHRMFNIAKKEARIGIIIPSAFSSNSGTAQLRNQYFSSGHFEKYFSFINKRKIFQIHSMFRFLLLIYQKGKGTGVKHAAFNLTSLAQAEAEKEFNNSRFASLTFLDKLTSNLMMIPEINSKIERSLLTKLYNQHPHLGTRLNDGWNVSFHREVDITNESSVFVVRDEVIKDLKDYTPLFEGRMINQFDYAAKVYVSGHGRKAVWNHQGTGQKKIVPHYYVPSSYISSKHYDVTLPRAGFCDISGHQNERTLLTTLIPPNSICSNKVPTVKFERNELERHCIWIAIMNSFVMDWIVRRWISTTINFFYLNILPFPRIDIHSILGREIADMSLRLCVLNPNHFDSHTKLSSVVDVWQRAEMRSKIDASVAHLFNLKYEELNFIFNDFPLVDSKQAVINNEGKCSLTKSMILMEFVKMKPNKRQEDVFLINQYQERISLYRAIGTLPYTPSSSLTTMTPKSSYKLKTKSEQLKVLAHSLHN